MMDIKSAVARLLYPYGSIRTVLRGPLRGYKYVVGPSMGATYAFGVDENDQSFLHKNVTEGSIVFDVGANRGQLTLLFARTVGEKGNVVSFEPVEELAQQICRNARLNSLENVEVVQAAASVQSGTTQFKYSSDRSTQGMLKNTEPTYNLSDTELIEVPTTTLDEVAEEMGLWPDMIKVDVEGGGRQCFRELSALLTVALTSSSSSTVQKSGVL